jgi:hypothetical protein
MKSCDAVDEVERAAPQGAVSLRDPSHFANSQALASVRHQMALARTLLDEAEELVPSSRYSYPPSGQLIDELTRLGHRVLEAAAFLAAREERDRDLHLERDSGAFPLERRPAFALESAVALRVHASELGAGEQEEAGEIDPRQEHEHGADGAVGCKSSRPITPITPG